MTFIKNWLDQADAGVDSALEKSGADKALQFVNKEIGKVESELQDVTDFLNRFNRNLPRYHNSQAAVQNWEPVFLNQFDIVITPPAAITGNGYFTDLLVEQVKNISGLPEITPTGTIEQKYLWAKRTFSKPVPDDTTAELEIEFEINLNSSNQMYTYDMLRAWADLSFDYSVGYHGLKRQYVGEITVLVHNKVRRVFRQFNFKPVYMTNPMNNMELDYLSDGIYVLKATFKADAWVEKRHQMPVTLQ